MARRFGNSGKRDPQLALNGTKLHGCIRVIQLMKMKQVRLAKQDFTLPELMELFVDREHHVRLRYVYELIEPTGHTNAMYVRALVPPALAQFAANDAHIKFTWWGKKDDGFYVPRDAGATEQKPARVLEDQASPALIEKYRQVETDLLDIQCRFALCERVLRNLNRLEVCRTVPQIRYVWPAIQILLSKADYKDEAAEIAEASIRAGDKANVPYGLGKVLKETNDSIVRALMLDDAPMPSKDQVVPYELEDHFVSTAASF